MKDLPLLVRGRVRDLETGDERYFKSYAELTAYLDGVLDAAGLTPRHWDAGGGR